MKNNQWNVLRHKGAEEDKVFVGPQSVEIHVTNACALSCLFCPYHFCGDEQYPNAKKHIDLEVFKTIIDDCETLKVEFIVLTGEGDPFSHPDICSMISYAKDKNITLNIDTHGLFPGKKVFPYALRTDRLNINIPGVDEASYQESQFDKKNCFEQAAANVRLIAQYQNGQRPWLNWIYVVTKDSFRYISRVLSSADELGFDSVSFRLAHLHEDTDQMAIMGEDLKELKKEIAAALRITGKATSNIRKLANEVASMVFYDECKMDSPNNSRSNQIRSIYFEKTFPENFSCLVGWHKAFVDMNGDAILCGGNLQTVVGNVYKERLIEIWKGPRAQEMRSELKYHFDLNKKFFRECRTCPFMSVSGKDGEAVGQMEWAKS
jgi:radical SAM protein with 4Fe4S-binding SPASM domain